MAKSPDRNPAKRLAQMALTGMDYSSDGDLLEEVIRYAFDQLCWLRSYPDIDALLADLRALVSEEA